MFFESMILCFTTIFKFVKCLIKIRISCDCVFIGSVLIASSSVMCILLFSWFEGTIDAVFQ